MEQIDPRRLLTQVARILEKLRIPYIVTGGISVLIWGRPRFTADIDIVVELKYNHLEKLEKALLELGKAGYIDKETMRDALDRHGEFNFVDGETGVKVDFWVAKENEFSKNQFRRCVVKKILKQQVYFISPEDLILNKLLWNEQSASSRQLEDIESIVKISGKMLDIKYIAKWAKKLGVLENWSRFSLKIK